MCLCDKNLQWAVDRRAPSQRAKSNLANVIETFSNWIRLIWDKRVVAAGSNVTGGKQQQAPFSPHWAGSQFNSGIKKKRKKKKKDEQSHSSSAWKETLFYRAAAELVYFYYRFISILNPSRHVQVTCFLHPTVQNPDSSGNSDRVTETKKSNKTSHLRSRKTKSN